MGILWIFSLSFVLTFSSAFAAQSVQEEEVKTEERCLVRCSSHEIFLPTRKEELQLLVISKEKPFTTPLTSVEPEVSRLYALYCQWVFYG
ncbi:hypothetical protein [Marinoscillum sp.]|uniref:hypothetical protein n=1 Tax=Marinoscillum sp. TaxID=2024838 RepID=UPI003BABF115